MQTLLGAADAAEIRGAFLKETKAISQLFLLTVPRTGVHCESTKAALPEALKSMSSGQAESWGGAAPG